MIKNLLFVCCFVAGLLFASAQERKDLHTGACGTDALHLKLLKEDADYKEKFDKNNALWQEWAPMHTPVQDPKVSSGNKLKATSQTSNAITLQVVFHDMYNAVIPPSPIIYETLVSKLNTIYAGAALGANIPVSNDTGVQFCLAKQDTFGNVYTATQHHTGLATIDPAEIDQINQIVTASNTLLTFPKTRYINVYIVDAITGGHPAFSFLPSAHGHDVDGIYIIRSLLNEPNEATLNNKITTLAHEMGHYLGLFHTFGICNADLLTSLPPTDTASPYACSCFNDNCLANGDMVCDTFPMKLNQQCAVPSYSCNSTTPDIKNNYMDYIPTSCRTTFTQGQIDRMHFMLNPDYGARKSLLGGTSFCVNCNTISSFQPVMSPIPPSNVFEQNQTVVLNANFLNGTIAYTSAGTVNYTWSIQSLDGGTATTPISATSFTLDCNSLAVGNYNLTLTAAINANCFKTITYAFSVVPINNLACGIQLPTANPTTAADWNSWKRVYYENGWSRASDIPGSDYTFSPYTSRTETISTDFADNGFDIINISQLTNDPNFANIPTTPISSTPPASTKLMRVGKRIVGSADLKDGAAYYVSYTFQPTSTNCKYRIWYLGMANLPTNPSIAYQNFNINQGSSASFGFLSRYQFNSPALITNNNPTPTVLGMNENGQFIGNPNEGFISATSKLFGLNDMVFGRTHCNPTNDTANFDAVTVSSISYLRTKKWQFYDIDFSEFVDTPGYTLGTTITLTFFARTNDATAAKNHSYAYFGVECKGGGLPADITMNLPNIQLPCQIDSQSCAITQNLPKPKYALEKTLDNGNSYFTWLNVPGSNATTYPNLATLKVEVTNEVPTPTTVYTPISDFFKFNQSDNHYTEYYLNLCNSNAPNTSLYYRVTLNTLHKSVVSIFRVTNGFAHSMSPPCEERLGVINGSNIITYCNDGSNPNQTITLQYNPLLNCDGTPLLENPRYIWKTYYSTDVTNESHSVPVVIQNATGATLDVIPANLTNCLTYFARYTEFEELFCGKQYFRAQAFQFFNTSSFNASSFTATPTDICINDVYSLNVTNFKLTLPNCPVPSPFSGQNTVKLELVKGNNASYPALSNQQTINYNATLTDNTGTDVTLSFSNQISLSNGGGYVFGENGIKTIYLKITYSLFGCPPKVVYKPVTFTIANSSTPGSIGLGSVDCAHFSTATGTPSGETADGVYGWEYCLDNPLTNNSVFITLPGNHTEQVLVNYPFSSIPGFSNKVYLRRFSIGLGSCAVPNTYTAAIAVTNIPVFEPLSFCSTNSTTYILPIVSSNGISGSWNLALPSTKPPVTTTYFNYQFTLAGNNCPTPNAYNIPVTVNVTPDFNYSSALSLAVCNGTQLSSIVVNPTTSGTTVGWYLSSPGGNSQPNTAQNLIAPGPYNFTVAQVINGCRGPKKPVTITISNATPPTASPTQPFCNNATVFNLSAAGTGIKWYDVATGGTALAINTALTSGTTYYASQTVGNCESTRTAVLVTVNPVITPIFTEVDPVCAGVLPQLPNSSNSITGLWAQDVILSTSIALVYNFTPTPGQCASTATMTITVKPTPQQPPVTSPQNFCGGSNPTINSLSSTALQWYDAISGGNLLNSSTPLTSVTYYASQTVNGCVSPRATVVVTLTTTVQPTADSLQTFCTGATVSDLVPTGAGIAWYSNANDDDVLASNTVLTTGTYYVSQTVTGCKSIRTQVNVTVATLAAVNDDFYYVAFVNATTGWKTPSVLTNDTFDFSYPPSINIGIPYPPLLGITANADGTFTLPNAVPGTEYEIPYTITQNGCTSTPAYVAIRVSNPDFRADGPVWVVDTQENATDSDKKIIISGEFYHYNSVNCKTIARLNNDLTLDPTFKIPYWFNLNIYDMKVLPIDNKILIAGRSDNQNYPNDQHGIMRLNADGSIDTTFNNGALYSNVSFRGAQVDSSPAQVTKIFVLPDGNLKDYILVAGYFNKYNGYPVHYCVMLNPDGSYDPTLPFNINLNKWDSNSIYLDSNYYAHGFSWEPYTFAFQRGTTSTDWKIIVGGEFGTYQGLVRGPLIRLNSNGTLDTSFGNFNDGRSGIVTTNDIEFVNKVIVEPGATPAQDNIIVAGRFDFFNKNNNSSNVPRKNIMRLNYNGILDDGFNVGNGFSTAAADTGFPFGGQNATVKDMFLDTSGTEHLLYVCGRFTTYNDAGCDEIIRIKCNTGIKDPSFQLLYNGPNGTDNGPVYSMKEQYDATTGLYSNILLGGNFTTYADDSGATHAKFITRISKTSNSIENKSANTYLDSEPEISDLSNNELILYPNPSSGKINFITSVFNNNLFNVFVYNTLGQKMFEKINLTAKESELNLSNLKAGTYFITFSNGDKTITKTIILN